MAEEMKQISKKHLQTVMKRMEELTNHVAELEEEKAKLIGNLQSGKRSERIEVPPHSTGETQKFRIGGTTGYIHCSNYSDGSLGQLFLNLGKEGSLEKGLGDALARVISIGIQYGVPPKAIIKTIKDMEFFPNGPVEWVEGVKGAKSIPDMLARYVEIQYTRKTLEKKVAQQDEIIKEVGEAAGKNGNGLKVCPECKEKTLKTKAMGCNDLCSNCGNVVVGGCGG